MKLYLSTKDVEIVTEALELMRRVNKGGTRAEALLERIEQCKQLQKPHNQHKPT